MAWPFRNNQAPVPAPAPVPERRRFDLQSFAREANYMAENEEKNFDWMHYQTLTQGAYGSQFAGEFNIIPTVRILKGMYLQEPWINYSINAIMRQFLGAKFLLKRRKSQDGSAQIVTKHAILDYMRLAGSDVESMGFFTANNIADLCLGGNAYWWTSKDLKQKRRIPVERLEPVVRNNKIQEYRIVDRNDLTFDNNMLTFQPEEITHIKLPNPYTPHVGLAMVIATVLPVLIDKYGLEYVVAFFLRGGNTAGIIETNSIHMDQLLTFSRSLMQAFGSRRNMHADKILPEGATWKGQGNTFDQIKLPELISGNIDMFKAATGLTDTVLGIAKNVNRATAEIEMELFFRATVLPMQKIYCIGVMSSAIWARFNLDESWELEFDNAHMHFLDDFDQKLDQDQKLKSTWTINERRQRLGLKPLEGDYDKLEIEIKPPAAAPGANAALAGPDGVKKSTTDDDGQHHQSADQLAAWKSAELKIIDQVPDQVKALFKQEYDAWEEIVLGHMHSRNSAKGKVMARANEFARKLADVTTPHAMKAYDNQIAQAIGHKSVGSVVEKETDADRAAKLKKLRDRASDVVKGKILTNGRTSFVGYSDNEMDRVYDVIDDGLKNGKSLDEVAFDVRQRFGEAYEGQAQTIVRTEYGAAVSSAQAQFGHDLSTMTSRMSKSWVSMGDKHVRDSHESAEQESPIEDDSGALIDREFGNGLRYPRDDQSDDPGEVINCRCTIRYRPISWR